MRDKHEPQTAFVDRLESQIAGEVRKRNRMADAPRWAPSRWKLVTAAVTLALVSMSVGGAVVAAAYQAQDNQRRDLVAAMYELQLSLAKQAREVSAQGSQSMSSRYQAGLATKMELLEAQGKVREAEAQIRRVELQLEEVRLTGREPLDKVSAPLVSGKDFVSERLRNDLTVPKSALEVERTRFQDARTRMEIGVEDALSVAAAEAKTRELEAAIVSIERKIEIRQRFLRGTITADQTELYVLEAEAESRLLMLKPRLEVIERQLEQTARRVSSGTAPALELAEGKLKREQVRAELAKTELELALVRQKLSGK